MNERSWYRLLTLPRRYFYSLASMAMSVPPLWFRILIGTIAAANVIFLVTRVRRLNWDVIPYLALVAKPRFADWSALHSFVYETIRSFVDEAAFQYLVSDGSTIVFRELVFRDHSALEQISAYYDGRVGYILLARFLSALGLGDLQALIVLSAGSAAAIAFVVGFMIAGLNAASVILVFPILSLCHVHEVARLVTPDALAAMLAIGIAILLRRKCIDNVQFLGILTLCGILVLVRRDFVIFSLIFLSQKIIVDSRKVRWLFVALMCIVIYGLVETQFSDYGYWALFYHTFVAPLPFPEHGYPTLSIVEIARQYLRGTWNLISSGGFVVLGAGFISLCKGFRVAVQGKNAGFIEERGIALGSLLFVCAHFLLFPAGFWRFYVAPTVLVAIAVLKSYWRADRQGVAR